MQFSRRRHLHWSPLILVIFITCFHNVLTRHRIRHHRDRFKRQQGAHLYLPGSYVYDGGDGGALDAGPWEEWSSPSPCSRTCGGGVSTEMRQCSPGQVCQGPTTRHFSCNTQDCPDSGDFRSQQCSEFDSIPFEGVQYQWVPYTKAPNSCELNCMPRGERFYFRHRPLVVDGTRCNDESLDVCVQGKCQPVGCDMMLGSPAREDACRKCGGNGSTCNTISDSFTKQDLQVGYNDFLLVPVGATNILVQEIAPSNNYLAVRNKTSHYYLNGNWRIDFPRTMEFAGCKFHYERSPQGFAAPDKITCLGPIDESIVVVLLYQDRNVGVHYEYSLPTNIQPGAETESYAWTFDQFSPCSQSCGGGTQYRNVTCAGRRTLEPVDRGLCDAHHEPPAVQRCGEVACEAQWAPYPWGNCSASCGEGGVQTREVACQQMIANGQPSLVDEAECLKVQPKPQQQQACNKGKVCAKWHLGPWKPCSHLCGDGKETRKLTCYRDENKRIELLGDEECDGERPEDERKCNVRPCEGVDWITSEWSGCDKCGLTNETRKVQCSTASGIIYSEDLCDKEDKPELVRQCTTTKTNCEYNWYASQWSECSAQCGQGVQSRTLFCGVVGKDNKVEKVDESKCDHSKAYETLRNCTGALEKCPGEWFSGPWTDCSKSCGGGERSKKVVCLRDLQVVDISQCGADKIVFGKEECNVQPCSEDTILPKDVTKPVDESEPPQESTTTQPVSESSTDTTFEASGDDEDAEYEIVPDDECEDGEWVDSGSGDGEEQEEEEQQPSTDLEDLLGTGTEAGEVTGGISGSGFTDEELMLSDAPSSSPSEQISSAVTGSGDGEITSPLDSSLMTTGSTLDEGSGDESTGTEPTIIEDTNESATVFMSSSSMLFGSSPDTTTTTESSSSLSEGDESESTTELSDVSTTNGDSSSDSSQDISSDVTASSVESSDVTDASSFESSHVTDSSFESSDVTTSSVETSDVTTSSDESSSSSDFEETSNTETRIEISVSTESSSDGLSSIQFTIVTDDSSDLTTTEESVPKTTNVLDKTNIEETIVESGHVPLPPQPDEDEEEEEEEDEENTDSSPSTTDISGSTESVSGGSTEISASTETAATDSSEGSTDISASTETATDSSELSTDISGSTESATDSSDLSTEISGSTESVTDSSDLSTEISGSTESVTEASDLSTEISGSTESVTEASGFTTEASASTETDIWSSASASTESGQTEEDLYGTTPITDIFTTRKPRMCKRKIQKSCKKTKHGCCWDHITPAKGPFDEGCPAPKTCKESQFGCCEDGVSQALGRKFKGCPSTHCNETLFGCCPDKKTPAEGSNKEGCPPPPPACLKTKFGCCKDNKTAASGPKEKGCKKTPPPPPPQEDCHNSTYGCCPDEVYASQGEFFKGCDIFKDNCTESYFGCCPDNTSSAQGPNFKGCKVACSESSYGCCPDGVTPAHGYNREGCCLASPFGCCPDNVVSARGPNLEGCGCQYSPYRCCPDNTTAARGHNNEGCGCQFTEHGCCPDSFTPASGPEYSGCLCNTFQFGCCPDGVSVAKGPHQQGCGCRNTEFGCCSDDSTPAQGPNFAGCGCDSSKYGCCPDGVSEAQGEAFENCTEIPPNLQQSCSQTKERGSCRNYTVKWFYDMDYGGCSRFWYGGCEGNDNRFKSKEECDGVCVSPEGTDRCKLPKVAGPCEGYYPQWYYDSEAKNCAQFIYGGCLGNNNRFETREDCLSLCLKDDSVDACEQEKDEGPCRGQYRRWYFDKTAKSCQQFVYGGCKSNNNNFPTEEACKQQCAKPGRKKDLCSLPRAQGNCTESRQPKWYYDIPEKRCLPFYYSGCGGNDNNFNSREACETDCPREVEKDTCHLAADIGTCGNYTTRWYFDTREKACRQFYYGGCEGNANNFESEGLCKQQCAPRESQEVVPVQEPDSRPSEAFNVEQCFLPSEQGECQELSTRYFYDRADGVCKSFTYGGCRGNANNFNSLNECLQFCGNAQDLCSLPAVVGPCDSEYEQFFYDARTDSCRVFKYGGCGGNYNRFENKTDCESRCRRAPPEREEVTTQAPPRNVSPLCGLEVDAGNCSGSEPAYFFDGRTGLCTLFSYTGCGGNGNRFVSEEQCERQCGRFVGDDVCSHKRDPGRCRGYFVKYYYDREVGRCGQFAYGGCEGNGNRFSSNEECEAICMRREEQKNNISSANCELKVEQGKCQSGSYSSQRWYFNNEQGECLPFIFFGCGGNLNNFKTFQTCIDFCRDYITATIPPASPEDHPCQAHFDECATLQCPYGVEVYVDDRQCNRCQCSDPCKKISCPEGTQCAIDLNRNRTDPSDAQYVPICREIEKPGKCPNYPPNTQTTCQEECRNDAHCSLQLKCCQIGCSSICVEPQVDIPAELVTQSPPQPAYTAPPVETQYFAPQINNDIYKPEVQGLLGDYVTLNCAVSGNPRPQITWKKDNLLIDGTEAKYRIKLDQTLQIVTLHKTDAGIYLCTAENNVGEPVTNQIKLDVIDDGVTREARVLDEEEQPNVVVNLNAPATLHCGALGNPFPQITWWKDDNMMPLKTSQFEVRKDYSLIINAVRLRDLGIYTCQAYNGYGKAASWSVVVKAKGPYFSTSEADQPFLKYIVNVQPDYNPPPPPEYNRLPVLPPRNDINPIEGGRPAPPSNIVPVETNITMESERFPTNTDIVIPCEVEGYPEPQVQWYKDGVPLNPSERVVISKNNKLTLLRATKADSGSYQCEATNTHSRASSAVAILVDGIYIHPNCKDNRYFAKCELIVKARFCSHQYYAKFCCRSCTEAGLLPVDGPHLQVYHNKATLGNNLV